MRLTLLLDLDDTLLDTNMDVFVPAYFQALAKHLKDYVKPDVMLQALMSGTQRMLDSDDPLHTLQEIFDADFYPKLGIPKEQLIGAIDYFYDNVFPTLGIVTGRRPGAKELVDQALARGFRVAIATDPVFPRKATYHRIRWAGFEPERFDLISSYETFHFTKSHPAYYAEVLGRLGWPDGPVLMVGNDEERDLVSAQKLGLPTYHIIESSEATVNAADQRGDLAQLATWLNSADFTTLEPSFGTSQAVSSILAATPGILDSMTAGLNVDGWSHAPTAEDWSMTELVCHLRDTEREVHHMQIEVLLKEPQPFVPRPDTAVWASQRDYQSEEGRAALKDYGLARVETLSQLTGLGEDMWRRAARHAIFGPTNFMEVVGFMGDHDRLHVQQSWNLIKTLSTDSVS